MQHMWDDLLTEQDKAVIKQANYDTRGARAFESRVLGERAAVLVIDMQHLIVGEDTPILDAIAHEPMAMGEIAWRAMDTMVPFVNACRDANLPIIYTRIIPRGYTADDTSLDIVTPLAPHTGDHVIDKDYPSSFHDTDLQTHLITHNIDTIILVGNSTSGCVRATAVDGRQRGFCTIVPHECVFDRIEASHKISLLDMWMKYATVISTDETLAYINSII